MLMPPNTLLVSEIAGNHAILKIGSPTMQIVQGALDLGFKPEEGRLVREISGHEERVDLINKLIRIGAIFIGGPGWSPSQVVAQYKEEGKVPQPYREIVWHNPESYEITEII